MKKTIHLNLNSLTGKLEFTCAEDVKIVDKKTLSLINAYDMHDANASADEKNTILKLMRKRKFYFEFAAI